MQGQVLNRRYIAVGKLRQEGSVEVWSAFDERLERKVIVKLLPPMATYRQSVTSLEQAISRVGRLSHPNILQLLDFGETTSNAYLVFEHITGQSLADVIHARGSLESVQAMDIITQMASALTYAHKQGVFHGSLSPRGIWMTESLAVKVDFLPGETLEWLTTGHRLETYPWLKAYLAPEVIAGASASAAADIYSLAVVLLALNQRTTELVANASIPHGWRQALRTALDESPERRPSRPSQLVLALQEALPRPVSASAERAQLNQDQTVIVPAVPPGDARPSGTGRLLSATALLISALFLLTVSSGVYMFLLRPSEQPTPVIVPTVMTEWGILPGEPLFNVYIPLVLKDYVDEQEH